jgi:hypothetical protein
VPAIFGSAPIERKTQERDDEYDDQDMSNLAKRVIHVADYPPYMETFKSILPDIFINRVINAKLKKIIFKKAISPRKKAIYSLTG